MLNGLVGTSNAGVYSFGSFKSVLTPSSDGLPATRRSEAWVSRQGERTFLFLAGGLYDRISGGLWKDASNGLPAGETVNAIGGAPSTFAAVDAHGIWRRMGYGNWQPDSDGANSAVVTSFAGSFAAARTAGVLRHADGAWMPETSGLPPGTDARVIAAGTSGSPFFFGENLFLGTGGQGLFEAIATPVQRVLPALVDTVGATGRRFRTEITIGNLGPYDSVDLLVSRPPGSHDPTHSVTHGAEGARRCFVAALDGTGYPCECRGDQPDDPSFGWLRRCSIGEIHIRPHLHDRCVRGDVRRDARGADGYRCGRRGGERLRPAKRAAGVERSNLAVLHVSTLVAAPTRSRFRSRCSRRTEPPHLTSSPERSRPASSFSGTTSFSSRVCRRDRPATPGSRRVAGIGAWTGYGVVNDAATSDGVCTSALPAGRPRRGAAPARAGRPRRVRRGRIALHDRADARERFGAAVARPSTSSITPLRASGLRSPRLPLSLAVGAGRAA